MAAALALAAVCAAAGAAAASPEPPPASAEERAQPEPPPLPRPPEKLQPAPIALALESALGSATWSAVSVSTAGPVVDVTKLVRAGFYKREIVELIVMCAASRRPLAEAVARRKAGARLSEIAGELLVDYAAVQEEALAVEESLDREHLHRFVSRRVRRKPQ